MKYSTYPYGFSRINLSRSNPTRDTKGPVCTPTKTNELETADATHRLKLVHVVKDAVTEGRLDGYLF